MDDNHFMQMALDLAARGRGFTSPNPMVGAVVVREGRVVGRGYHHAAGQAHAEVNALDDAGPAARGATLYVTLEPCNHHGRTPPCTQRVLAAGVRRMILETSFLPIQYSPRWTQAIALASTPSFWSLRT